MNHETPRTNAVLLLSLALLGVGVGVRVLDAVVP